MADLGISIGDCYMKHVFTVTRIWLVGMICASIGLAAAATVTWFGWIGQGIAQLSDRGRIVAYPAGAILLGSILAVVLGLILSSITAVMRPSQIGQNRHLSACFLGMVFLSAMWGSLVAAIAYWRFLMGWY